MIVLVLVDKVLIILSPKVYYPNTTFTLLTRVMKVHKLFVRSLLFLTRA